MKTSQFEGGAVILVFIPIKTDVEMPKSFFPSAFFVTLSPEFYHSNRPVSFEIQLSFFSHSITSAEMQVQNNTPSTARILALNSHIKFNYGHFPAICYSASIVP